MTSEAWDDYGVPVSPYFVLVDGPSGRVVGEGAGTSWEQVARPARQGRGRRGRRHGPARPARSPAWAARTVPIGSTPSCAPRASSPAIPASTPSPTRPTRRDDARDGRSPTAASPIDLPTGWDGQIRAAGQGAAAAARLRPRPADAGAEPSACVLHAASFALPAERGDYGSGAVEVMGGSDVLVCLLEHEPDAAGDRALRARGRPPAHAGRCFSPQSMQRAIAGMAGSQHFFQVGGRPFCLYVVVGSWRTRAPLVRTADRVASSIRITGVTPAAGRTRRARSPPLVLLGRPFEPAGAQPAAIAAVAPPGTTTLVEDAAWSWFEDARVVFTGDGSALTTSAVTGTGSTTAAPGTVVLAEVDLATGARRLVDLGRGEADDHNSASIHESRRRRADDGVDEAQPRPAHPHATAAHRRLVAAAPAAQRRELHDLQQPARRRRRGRATPCSTTSSGASRFDPDVIASADVGRTWTRLGRVLRDPLDLPSARPYVQYSHVPRRPHRPDRHRDPPELHPDLRVPRLHPGRGRPRLGWGRARPARLGHPGHRAHPGVGSLRRASAAWTADIVVDPATGAPTVAFSVRHADDDHRYWYGRWTGAAWAVEEIAFAGRALYPAESHYTGLITLDPRTAATSSSLPTSRPPPVRRSCRRATVSGTGSSATAGGRPTGRGRGPPHGQLDRDNLRPVLTASESGASALLWLRGRYTSYIDYDLDVVGVVRRAERRHGAARAPATWAPVDGRARRAHPAPAARPGWWSVSSTATPPTMSSSCAPARGPDDLLLGDEQRHPTPVATRPVQTGSYPRSPATTTATAAPTSTGTPRDRPSTACGPRPAWRQVHPQQPPSGHSAPTPPSPATTTATAAPTSTGTPPAPPPTTSGPPTPAAPSPPAPPARSTAPTPPSPATTTATASTDIYWYAPGPATDHLWTATAGGTFTTSIPRQVNGTYTPIPGDYDGDGQTDIYWYAPGPATDHLWTATAGGTFTTSIPRQVNGTYTPIPGDHDGDGTDDIHWYGLGTRRLPLVVERWSAGRHRAGRGRPLGAGRQVDSAAAARTRTQYAHGSTYSQ